jgi:potassium/chloride transporter 9
MRMSLTSTRLCRRTPGVAPAAASQDKMRGSVAYSSREAVPLLGGGSSGAAAAADDDGGGGAAAGRGQRSESEGELRNAGSAQLGTFLGVVVPCLANIFGLTIFVRVPFIVGQVGLVWALGLYAVSVVVSSLTLCSICALVTNGHIGGGGAYFIISRSLGPEFGGAIGVVFYFANLIGVTAYCNVMTTQLKDAMGKQLIFVDHKGTDDYIFYSLFLALFTATAMGGARLVARASLLIMALVLCALYLAMLSLIARPPGLGHEAPGGSVVGPGGSVVPPGGEYDWFTGWSSETLHANLGTAFREFRGDEFSLSVIFGIIFPSCTGVMSGAKQHAAVSRRLHES